MSSLHLFLMGFLVEAPWNAYELVKFFENRHIKHLVKFSTPSIYRNLVQLEKRGYLSVRTEREGDLPEKKIYSATDTGKTYFRELMDHFAGESFFYHFDFNVVILNLGKLPREEGLTLLDQLRALIQSMHRTYEMLYETHRELPFEARMVMKQHAMLSETLLRWIDTFIQGYREIPIH